MAVVKHDTEIGKSPLWGGAGWALWMRMVCFDAVSLLAE
jgi:hypothetical protein